MPSDSASRDACETDYTEKKNLCRQLPSSRRSLTFNPSLDNESDLRSYLRDVLNRYNRQRRNLLSSSVGAQHHSAGGENPTPSQMGLLPSSGGGRSRLLTENGSIDLATRLAASATEAAADVKTLSNKKPPPHAAKMTVQKATLKEDRKQHAHDTSAPKKKPHKPLHRKSSPRRKRNSNQTSILRAKSIDFLAPDPELEAPPGETADEKRRRLERINGRRKRAKKMIEIDHLNEQYHTLKVENQKLRTENMVIRDRIAMIRRLGEEGAGSPQEAAARPAAGNVARGEDKNPAAEETKDSYSSARNGENTILPSSILVDRGDDRTVPSQYAGLEELGLQFHQEPGGPGNAPGIEAQGVASLSQLSASLPQQALAQPQQIIQEALPQTIASSNLQLQQHSLPQTAIDANFLLQHYLTASPLSAVIQLQPPPQPVIPPQAAQQAALLQTQQPIISFSHQPTQLQQQDNLASSSSLIHQALQAYFEQHQQRPPSNQQLHSSDRNY
jgi:hypothetical protein